MSFTADTAAVAAADLALGIAEFLVYVTYDERASAALLGIEAQAMADFRSGDGNVAREAARQSRIVQLATDMATYAKVGSWASSQNDLMDALVDFEIATELLNGKQGPCLIGPDHVWLVSEESSAVLREVLEAAQTRLAIDLGKDITISMLAALAGVAEKTLRMAANPNNDRALKTFKEGTSTFIKSEDALEWLGRRSDFKPTRYFVSAGAMPRLVNFPSLGSHLASVRTSRGWSVEDVGAALEWSDDLVADLAAVESARAPDGLENLTPKALAGLAGHLGIHAPTEFAREHYPLIAKAYGEALAREQLT